MSSAPTTEPHVKLELDTAQYLERLKQIDRILERRVQTLLYLATPAGMKEGDALTGEPFPFPVWLREGQRPGASESNLLTQGICLFTLQHLSRIRRRFEWLEKAPLLSARGVRSWLARSFVPLHYDPESDPGGRDYFDGAMKFFRDGGKPFGTLNPFTAAQIFRTLIEAGEDLAHEGIGFLAFFAMIWPLYRRYPAPLLLGARIEPSLPTAYVTAKCLIPIDMLDHICRRRADLLKAAAESLKKLHDLADLPSYEQHDFTAWQFNAELDRLRRTLLRLSEIAIAGSAFRRAADEVGRQSDGLSTGMPLKSEYAKVEGQLRAVLKAIAEKTREVLEEARVVVEGIKREIVSDLSSQHGLQSLKHRYGLEFAEELIADDDYREDLQQSATKAAQVCEFALVALADAGATAGSADSPGVEAVLNALRRLAEANQKVAAKMDKVMAEPGAWCHSVVGREVAYASARNETDFDPAELASALLVTVRRKSLSGLQVREAVEKAAQAVRADGSWTLGHPYFSRDGEMGIQPPSADIVWTLTRCVEGQPQVRNADAALFSFVDWLDRMRCFVNLEDGTTVHGWGVDHMREVKVHVATTAYSINALLEIRDLVEFRLWQLCQERFTILAIRNSLADVDPVDLAAVHRHRLHSALSRMIRGTSVPDAAEEESAGESHGGPRPAEDAEVAEPPTYRDADYSLVLHGPPGSSKTTLINALAEDMWGSPRAWGWREPRLVRITPADFTRLGEDRIDSEARLIFQLLGHVRQVTILFDEIDDLLTERNLTSGSPPTFMGLVVPAMLNRLQDLRDACRHQEISFVLGTNYVDRIEPALIRRGRIDRPLAVVYPDHASRNAIVGRKFRGLNRLARERRGSAEEDVASWLDDKIRRWWNTTARETRGLPWNEVTRAATDSAALAGEALRKALEALEGPNAESALVALSEADVKIPAKIERLRSTVTLPDYSKRIHAHPSRADLRAEYIQFRICRLESLGDIEGIVAAERTEWASCVGRDAAAPADASFVREFEQEFREALSHRRPG